jgi:hypothetical protein
MVVECEVRERRGLVSNLIRVWGVVKSEERAGDAVPMREGNWWEPEVESRTLLLT